MNQRMLGEEVKGCSGGIFEDAVSCGAGARFLALSQIGGCLQGVAVLWRRGLLDPGRRRVELLLCKVDVVHRGRLALCPPHKDIPEKVCSVESARGS